MNQQQTIGDRLRLIRNMFGLSQAELAEKVSMSERAYGAVEEDYNLPSSKMLLALGESLGVSADYVLLGQGDIYVSKAQAAPLLPDEELYARFERSVKFLSHYLNVTYKDMAGRMGWSLNNQYKITLLLERQTPIVYHDVLRLERGFLLDVAYFRAAQEAHAASKEMTLNELFQLVIGKLYDLPDYGGYKDLAQDMDVKVHYLNSRMRATGAVSASLQDLEVACDLYYRKTGKGRVVVVPYLPPVLPNAPLEEQKLKDDQPLLSSQDTPNSPPLSSQELMQQLLPEVQAMIQKELDKMKGQETIKEDSPAEELPDPMPGDEEFDFRRVQDAFLQTRNALMRNKIEDLKGNKNG